MLAGYSSHLVTAFPGQFGGVYARSLIEAALDPMVTISPDGRIDDVNEATIKVTGLNLRVRQRQVEWGWETSIRRLVAAGLSVVT